MYNICSEYVDVDGALKRIGGNMDLYKRLLNQFSGEDHIDPLEEAFDVDSVEKASHLIHTLKGVAANLSLNKLYKVSIELEQKVKDGEDHGASFAELKNAYCITSQQIAEVLKSPTSSNQSSRFATIT